MRTLALIVSLGLSFALAAPPAALAAPVTLRDDAPDRHVVVKGDTLWDISARFLKSPWLWPQLWQTNKDHIQNPHLIYPGDVVYLVMTPEGPRLERLATVKLTPSVHAEPIAAQAAIQALPYAAIEPFLKRPLLGGEQDLAGVPRLIGTEDGRRMLALGNLVYADVIQADQADWHIVRLGGELKDPETGQVLARETEYIGNARLRNRGRPATLDITESLSEVRLGDRLVPASAPEQTDFFPHAPARPVAGRIISVLGGSQAGHRHATVIINKGRRDGLESGHVLAVFHPGLKLGLAKGEHRLDSLDPKDGFIDAHKERLHAWNNDHVPEPAPVPEGQVRWLSLGGKCLKGNMRVTPNADYDPATLLEECRPESAETMAHFIETGCLKSGTSPGAFNIYDPKASYIFDLQCPETLDTSIRLPDTQVGMIMIYRVFDRVSYALVMESSRPLFLHDNVSNP